MKDWVCAECGNKVSVGVVEHLTQGAPEECPECANTEFEEGLVVGLHHKLVDRVIAGGSGGETQIEEQNDPSHRCQSCGEEYFTNPEAEITACQGCGGAKVERLR